MFHSVSDEHYNRCVHITNPINLYNHKTTTLKDATFMIRLPKYIYMMARAFLYQDGELTWHIVLVEK